LFTTERGHIGDYNITLMTSNFQHLTSDALSELISIVGNEHIPAEIADAEYPLILTTDRSPYHYHSATMTRRVEGLEQLDSSE